MPVPELLRGITVCVNYSDTLEMTLRANIHHFSKWVIVTSHHDIITQQVVRQMRAPNLSLFQTNVFYKNGAIFNKGAAIELAFSIVERVGWIMVLDADIILPRSIDIPNLSPHNLYSPLRRMVSLKRYHDEFLVWSELPRFPDDEFAGYCQLFNATAPPLAKRPWYGTNWIHAGGCDSDFEKKWTPNTKVRPQWDVLHLGEMESIGKNWCGKEPESQAKLQKILERRRVIQSHREERLQEVQK